MMSNVVRKIKKQEGIKKKFFFARRRPDTRRDDEPGDVVLIQTHEKSPIF